MAYRNSSRTHDPMLPRHPGHLLMEQYLQPRGLEPERVAHDLGVPGYLFASVLGGHHDITPELALRLGCYFETTAEFWLELQIQYSLTCVRLCKGAEIHQQVQPLQIDAVASGAC